MTVIISFCVHNIHSHSKNAGNSTTITQIKHFLKNIQNICNKIFIFLPVEPITHLTSTQHTSQMVRSIFRSPPSIFADIFLLKN